MHSLNKSMMYYLVLVGDSIDSCRVLKFKNLRIVLSEKLITSKETPTMTTSN